MPPGDAIRFGSVCASPPLEFGHPVTGAWLTFDAPLPPDLARFKAEWER